VTDRIYRGVITGGRGLLRALRLTVRSEGQEHVPPTGPVVLASNHVSFPDFVFVQQAMLRRSGGNDPFEARTLAPQDRRPWTALHLSQRRSLGFVHGRHT